MTNNGKTAMISTLVDGRARNASLKTVKRSASGVGLHTLDGEHDRRVGGLAVVHETEVRPRVPRRHRLEAEGVAVVVEAPPTHRVLVPSSQSVLTVPSAIQ